MVADSRSPTPSLQRQFARALVFGVLLPALVMMAAFGWYDSNRQVAAVRMRMDSVAQSTAASIDEFMQAHRAILMILAQRRSDENSVGDVARWSNDLRRVISAYPAFRSMLVTNAAGTVVTSAPVALSYSTNVADRAYFTQVRRADRAYVSGAFRGRAIGTDPLVAVSAPLHSGNAFAGVVEASLRPDAIEAAAFRALEQRRYEAVLADEAGTVIHSTPGVRAQTLDALPSAKEVRLHRPMMVNGWLRDGDAAYVTAVPLSMGWSLFVLVPKSLVVEEVTNNLKVPIALLLLLSVGVGLAFWSQLRVLQRSVKRLLTILRAFALGGEITADPAAMPAELAPVVSAIDDLSARLNMAYRELRDALDHQKDLAESLQNSVNTRERIIGERTEQLRQVNAELDKRARTDELTGCLNYRGFLEVAPRLCSETFAANQPLAALALDVDLFKSYNDRYGHPAGDNALRRFAGAVRSALYRPDDVIGRPGGEEFIVLLPGASHEDALGAAHRIQNCLRRAAVVHADSPTGYLTVSIGVAMRNADGDCDAMLARADAALYRAKKTRNMVSD